MYLVAEVRDTVASGNFGCMVLGGLLVSSSLLRIINCLNLETEHILGKHITMSYSLANDGLISIFALN